ncbi:MAG: heme A synthase [Gammaproteobacteria bacterium]|nr:MAG: heme A synthase [Gammaproteobacteria bacterium]
MTQKNFYRLALFATFLAFAVVVLGAYVRLSNAGLGCPDWPGCYGKLIVSHEVAADPAKAWKEMIHRYLAGTLGLVIFALAFMAWRLRRLPNQPLFLPFFLVALVIFQALLGMWTVTLLLKPFVVMAHLLGGMTTLALLAWLSLKPYTFPSPPPGLHCWAVLGLAILVLQIALGGWTSANYAALACPDFPTCQHQWWPPMDFREAFTLWHEPHINYEGGVLENDARVAIHMMHRLGALVTFLFLGGLAIAAIARGVKGLGLALLAMVFIQVGLGISNVLLGLPLAVAVAHNAGAALLLLIMVALNYRLRTQRSP